MNRKNRILLSNIGISGAAIVLFAVALAASRLVFAATAASINTTIVNESNATTTSTQIGTIVHDTVVVSDPLASTTPTGTVDFTLYTTSTSCTGTSTTQSAIALVSGKASSATTTVPNTGLSYKVHYNGDSNFDPADGLCESLTAIKYTPTVSTDILNESNAVITSATASSSVRDRAIVSGAGPMPTGTVDFAFYTNNSCSSSASASGTDIGLVSGVATSSAQGPLTPGSYSFKAHYDGDDNYASADGPCEPLSIGVATPSIATVLSSTSVQVGTSVYDTATLSNTTAGASGSVVYTVFSNNTCSAGAQNAGTKTVTSSSVPNSDSVTFNTPGTYYWQAVYSGDANNAPATSTCTSEILTVLATSTPPNPPATTTPGTINGQIYNDNDGDGTKDSGESGLSGWTVRLSSFFWRFNKHFWWGGWGWNSGSAQTATTDGSGNYSFSNLEDGIYFVSEKTQSGWKPTTPPVKFVFIQNGTPVSGINFGNMQKSSQGGGNGNATTTGNSSLSGTVFNDQNDNDTKDSGESGLSGFTVNLYNGANFKGRGRGSVFKSTTSDSNGNYSFGSLPAGTYSIELIKKSDWKQTTSDFKNVTLNGSESKTGFDFGNQAKQQANSNSNSNDDKNKNKSNGKNKNKNSNEGRDDD